MISLPKHLHSDFPLVLCVPGKFCAALEIHKIAQTEFYGDLRHFSRVFWTLHDIQLTLEPNPVLKCKSVAQSVF